MAMAFVAVRLGPTSAGPAALHLDVLHRQRTGAAAFAMVLW